MLQTHYKYFFIELVYWKHIQNWKKRDKKIILHYSYNNKLRLLKNRNYMPKHWTSIRWKKMAPSFRIRSLRYKWDFLLTYQLYFLFIYTKITINPLNILFIPYGISWRNNLIKRVPLKRWGHYWNIDYSYFRNNIVWYLLHYYDYKDLNELIDDMNENGENLLWFHKLRKRKKYNPYIRRSGNKNNYRKRVDKGYPSDIISRLLLLEICNNSPELIESIITDKNRLYMYSKLPVNYWSLNTHKIEDIEIRNKLINLDRRRGIYSRYRSYNPRINVNIW